ncbi:hypothetical protein BAE44_0021111 [Dichanthelium oligosanthes]|uniref:Uncharacterized protein n=1 Tax=Dichanthelium oligosanthes TaxID=888268 RepID=A0A1E5UYA7_9POAL|nr:hypothetical protein BAE44_0021111 [Dichanthelium oligosanthes]
MVVAISIIVHSCSLVGIILMSFWYNGCWLNVAFIGTTMLLVYLMPLISLKYEAKGFLAGPGLVGTYIVFLCFSAIRSEPETKCYKKEKAGGGVNWETIFSFGFGLVSIAASVFSTGKDYKCIQLRCVVVSEDDVPYGYGFFHFVFAMGSMYFGMLFVGWDTHHTMEKWNMDVSWTSAWVHIVNEGLAVISFSKFLLRSLIILTELMAIVVARVYAIGWLRQLLARIFGIGDEPPHQPQQQQQQQQQQQFEMAILSGWSEDDDTEQEQEEQSATTAGFLSIPRPASPSSRSTGDGFSDVLSVSDDASYGGRSPSPASTDEIQEVTPPVDIAIAVAVLIDEEKRDRPASALRQRRRYTSHEGAGAGPSSSSSRPAILSDEEEV